MVPLIDKLILRSTIACCTMDSHTMGCLDRANFNQLYCMMKCLQFVSKTSPSGQDQGHPSQGIKGMANSDFSNSKQ